MFKCLTQMAHYKIVNELVYNTVGLGIQKMGYLSWKLHVHEIGYVKEKDTISSPFWIQKLSSYFWLVENSIWWSISKRAEVQDVNAYELNSRVTRSLVVIAWKIGKDTLVQFLDMIVFISNNTNILGKDIQLIILPPAIRK